MRAAWGVLFLSLVVNTSTCLAQTVGASLQGTVYDPSGGFVPGAAIEIRNAEQGAVRALITDDKGRYREPLLPPGEYELRVKVAGFQPVVLKGIKLTIGQDAVLDVKLEITGGVERINVSADEAPPIDLASAALSGTVNRSQMNSYSAEFGRSSGGIINAITRSGTNKLHGNLFEYLRNSALDAKNYFDPATNRIPPFKRNQFGGTLGGPIRQDKTFFFGAFEAVKEQLGVTGLTNVLDDNARNSATGAVSSLVQILFPRANGRVLGGGVAEYSFTRSQPTDEYFAQGRIDHHFSEKDILFGRYTFDNGNVDRQINNKPPDVFFKERSRNQYVTLEHVHTFSQRLLNTLRVSFARSTSEVDNQRIVDLPPPLSSLSPSAALFRLARP